MGPVVSIIDFIRDRARFYNCPVCGRSLKGCDVQVLSHEDERFHLQVTCAQCQVTFIVVLAIAGGAVDEIESPIAEPVEELPAAEPISIDEILDLHLFLKGFQGTLKELIHQPDHSRG
jgi:hydrogenase maturation factor HypF (carbamoyltransferase family)